jgi:phosphate transport system substrate-binding protein
MLMSKIKKSMLMSIVVLTTLAMLLTTLAAACGEEELSGKLVIKGSVTVYPIMTAAKVAFIREHPKVEIEIEDIGSTKGIESIIESTADIGMSSRGVKDTERDEAEQKGVDLQLFAIGWDGLTIWVNKANDLTEISSATAKAIFFEGTISDWSEIPESGLTGPIDVYHTNPAECGCALTFQSKIGDGEDWVPSSTNVPLPMYDIIPHVRDNPNAIGFSVYNYGELYGERKIKALILDGVAPSAETVADKSYPLARALYLVTNGEPEGLAAELVDFMLASEGQNIVEQAGFMPLD